MRIVVEDTPAFDETLAALAVRGDDDLARVEPDVRAILDAVRREGDEAVLRYAERFDARRPDPILRRDYGGAAALARLPLHLREALELAANRIKSFHERQRDAGFRYTEGGITLGCRVRPLDRVAVYAPGGKARYPSSVLMSAIPARTAGVEDILLVTPLAGDGGPTDDALLAAAHLSGVHGVVDLGGAHAVGAVAYGTKTVPKVDKIVGPGNIYVATAKGMVFGATGIDMIAGPSEILVICDGGTDPDWIAMDLFSQAEHDEDAQAILIGTDAAFLDAVAASIERLLPGMERAPIIRASLEARGALIRARDLDDAVAIANRIAPEHLELSVKDPQALAARIRHAGAIFMGRYTAEALGDYCAGPNHVLPTSRTARFSSPLGVYDFQKRSSLIFCSQTGASDLGRTASQLARGEGFTAHARSAEYRVKGG